MSLSSPQATLASWRLAWYQEAKLGLFIHWGAYSVAGAEASWPIMAPDIAEAMFGAGIKISKQDYTALPTRFNPLDFDADAWVQAAKAAGMRYIIITSKHHDGFCMFDAPGTDYKITNTPFGRDVCLELSQACARAGMKLGFYYSPPDMHHPAYRDTRQPAVKNWLGEPKREEWNQYLDYMESHIRKLLTGYGEVSILWFDGLVNHAKYDPPRFHRLVHELSPNTLINDRLGDGYDFITPEQFIPRLGIPVQSGKPPSSNDPGGDAFFRAVIFMFKLPLLGDWVRKKMSGYQDGTLELTPVIQETYPAPERFQPWETCMTMGATWAYNPLEQNWKTPQKLLHTLVEVVSRGGNYLLNVGPTDRGAFPPEALARLDHLGKWMAKHSQAIYGATYTPLGDLPWGRATRKGNIIYLHVFEWPASGSLEVPGFPAAAQKVSLLNGERLEFTQDGQRLEIAVPSQAPDPDVSVLAVEFSDPEANLARYSPAKETKTPPLKYLQTQAKASAIINAVANALIAFFSYRLRSGIPYAEAAVDILISVAIISYLTGWILVGAARSELSKGNIDTSKLGKGRWGLKLPHGAGLRALLIALACVILFGGLVLDGLLYLAAPGGLANWAYILIKTVYTGATGALASALAILSVFNERS